MATQVQRRRGTTAQHATFTGAVGEVTIDTDKVTAVVHDGVTAGGNPLLGEDSIGVTVQGYDADIPTVAASQAEMEAGTETALRSMSPAGVSQAISALSPAAMAGPAFRAYQSSAQTLPSVTFTKISLQAENYDTDNSFDSTTNYRFQPQVAGYYLIAGNVQFVSANYLVRVALYKNGAAHTYGDRDTTSCNVVDVIFLDGSTDYIELYANTATGQDTTALDSTTFMSGCLVRAA